MARSNLASDDTLTKRTSAGSLLPALTIRTSPGTMSVAIEATWTPSLTSMHSSGSIVLIDAMTRDDDQSCHRLKAAWMKKTMRRTIASARFAGAGLGSPSGFHDTKTRMLPMSRMGPKPWKKYPKIFRKRCVFGGDGAFFPYCVSLRFAWSADKPSVRDVPRRRTSSSTGRVCHSRSARSVTAACQRVRI
jgi:hypothetical protein